MRNSIVSNNTVYFQLHQPPPTPPPPPSGTIVIDYTYDIANRLTSVGGVTYTWDANGNLLSDGASTYTYDFANRMTAVSQGGSSYSFAYNGMGDRLQQTVNSATTNYTLDLNAGLTQVLADGTNTYLYALGRVAEQASTTWTYYHPDALGSVRQLSDSTGTLTLGQSFAPYGDILSSAGTGSTTYGFTGEWTDGTGLVNLRARYLNTGVRRFPSFVNLFTFPLQILMLTPNMV